MKKLLDILEVKNVYKRYGKKEVVQNMSFSVKEGEIMGFLGPNGARKNYSYKDDNGAYKYYKR